MILVYVFPSPPYGYLHSYMQRPSAIYICIYPVLTQDIIFFQLIISYHDSIIQTPSYQALPHLPLQTPNHNNPPYYLTISFEYFSLDTDVMHS